MSFAFGKKVGGVTSIIPSPKLYVKTFYMGSSTSFTVTLPSKARVLITMANGDPIAYLVTYVSCKTLAGTDPTVTTNSNSITLTSSNFKWCQASATSVSPFDIVVN